MSVPWGSLPGCPSGCPRGLGAVSSSLYLPRCPPRLCGATAIFLLGLLVNPFQEVSLIKCPGGEMRKTFGYWIHFQKQVERAEAVSHLILGVGHDLV